MPRFKLTLEYAGTRFHGWQIQKNARTVQGELVQAIGKAAGRAPLEVYGSGRTDRGVHALQQVAHVDLQTDLAPARLLDAINGELPADVNLLAVERVSHRFHARHGATGRCYLYQISRRRTAFAKPFVWWVQERLDLEPMRHAAALFVGLRDLRSFSADAPDEKSTRVQIDAVEVGAQNELVLIRVRGSHFVWKLVRRMVGVLVAVGQRQLEPQDVQRFLRHDSPIPARLTAPASGLFLERVLYEGEQYESPLQSVAFFGGL